MAGQTDYFDPATVAIVPHTLATDIQINAINTAIDNAFAALNAGASLTSPTLLGTPIAPTAAGGTNTTQIATTAFVINESLSSALPAGADSPANVGKVVQTNGTTGLWQWYAMNQGADVASAAELPILADGNYFDVTGTTGITSMATTGTVGTIIKLHFDGICTLTHDAANLVLPGGLDITTEAGEELEFIEYASGDFRLTSRTEVGGGGTITTGSSSITLTTSSGLVHQIAMTAADKSVTLPDATTLKEGVAFVFTNNGDYDFAVRNDSGALLGNCVAPKDKSSTVVAYLVDNSTSDGTWFFGNYDDSLRRIMHHTATEFDNSGTVSYTSVAVMSTTQAMVCYVYDTTVWATVLTVTDNTIVAATTPTSVDTAGDTYVQLTALDATTGVVVYVDETNDYGWACHLTMSGTGTSASVAALAPEQFTSANACTNLSVVALSSVLVLVAYEGGASSRLMGCELTIDGSADKITPGAETELIAKAATYTSLAKLTATTALVVWQNSTDTQTIAGVVTAAGPPTYDSGNDVVLDNNSNNITCVAMSATVAITIYNDATDTPDATKAGLLAISGTTVTRSTSDAQSIILGSSSGGLSGALIYAKLTKISATKAVVVGYNTMTESRLGFPRSVAYEININGPALDISKEVFINGDGVIATMSYIGADLLDTDKVIVTYGDGPNSSYGTAKMLEVAS